MALYGLVGYPLGHSQSPGVWKKIFKEKGDNQSSYELFPLKGIKDIGKLVENLPELVGLNVTTPYKRDVLSQLYEIDKIAVECWAVNTIKVGRLKGRVLLKGYNTDMPAFKQCMSKLLKPQHRKAIILGTGGAAGAAKAALKSLGIECILASRSGRIDTYTYQQLDAQVMQSHRIIVNCTPLGMHPYEDSMPEIPLRLISSSHLVFDMVYNPSETMLMRQAKAQGATVCNGAEMLEIQARMSWDIWNE